MANLATSPIRRRHSGSSAENDGETITYVPGDWTSCLFLLQKVPTVELEQCVCLREVESVSEESMSQQGVFPFFRSVDEQHAMRMLQAKCGDGDSYGFDPQGVISIYIRV
jgi:hypothetical protein